MGVLREMFSWPDGIVVGNLIASGMCTLLAALHLDRLARRHHREKMAQADAHHAEHMAVIRGE
jgi:hypothetical protein